MVVMRDKPTSNLINMRHLLLLFLALKIFLSVRIHQNWFFPRFIYSLNLDPTFGPYDLLLVLIESNFFQTKSNQIEHLDRRIFLNIED